MSLSTPLLMLATAAGWCLLRKFLREQARFKRRIIDEVADLLRKPDEHQLRELLDPDQDRRLRFPAFGRPDRREQRVRLDRLHEQYHRLHHNVLIVYEWADTEWYDLTQHRLQESYGPELCAKIKEVRQAAIEFRRAMRLVLAKIWLLSLIHFDKSPVIPIPSVAALARSGRVEIMKAYERVKDAAINLAAVYGEANEFADEIGAVM